ncbi:hypothetical protein [Streptomyces goshikiensis]|uniref:hypothetical protein n=1 Tax=Streptomyces goshikiensis TaxID=1942 RepID=UPI0036B22F3A
MAPVVEWLTLHVVPPLAVFAAWNEFRKGRVGMVALTVLASCLCGAGLLFESTAAGAAGLLLLVPPVLVMRLDFWKRADD